VLRIFVALKKKSIASAGLDPVGIGSNGKNANHYTTKVAS
jgi:hypothetical protein